MNEKEQWVINYIKKVDLNFVDILNVDFVYDYVETFNEPYEDKWENPKCKSLSKLLSAMYKKGLIDRFPHGVRAGLNQDSVNFKSPKWVYSYILKK